MKFKCAHIFLTLCIIALLIFLANDSMSQCSMCRKIATDGANSKTAGNALNHGILYLLALPYFMIAFIFRKQIVGFMRSLLAKK